uniref:DUF3456 domain-containing protein n=1 Tax=Acrobeloides nanus TaxID=290746 RepID=A0A914BVZ9_9BILA
MIITEMESSIVGIDPKRKITVGSFRVDGKGDQKGLNEIPYARSEAHINELIDEICEKSKKYVQAVHPETGKTIYAHEDNVLHYRRIHSPTITSKLQSACNDIVDEHEEDIVKFLTTSKEDPVKEFCHVKLGLCTAVDVKPYPIEKEDENDGNTPPENPPDLENDEL